jgi:hypothetical protein
MSAHCRPQRVHETHGLSALSTCWRHAKQPLLWLICSGGAMCKGRGANLQADALVQLSVSLYSIAYRSWLQHA